MSETHISALDHIVQQTNLWLKKLIEAHHFEDRHQAYNALRAVIQTLRDQLLSSELEPGIIAKLIDELPHRLYHSGVLAVLRLTDLAWLSRYGSAELQ